jgi:hypothetical protein
MQAVQNNLGINRAVIPEGIKDKGIIDLVGLSRSRPNKAARTSGNNGAVRLRLVMENRVRPTAGLAKMIFSLKAHLRGVQTMSII